MKLDLTRPYRSADFEEDIRVLWENAQAFKPAEEGLPFVLVLPPPNVTGILHMGHGLNMTLQDVLARYWRLKGRCVLWLPGTDHAGIATQNVVEKVLKNEGLSRLDLGRERFEERIWQWTKEHQEIISQQLKKTGSSMDWSRESFTLDSQRQEAVSEAFLRLAQKGYIYRGEYLVNWDPSTQTAVSDEEVEYQEVNGFLYHIRYPLANHPQKSVEIATTRPETMLGDVALAVHPDDQRYQHLIGKEFLLPLVGRCLPLIADEMVDPSFGTGVVKITPAHDPNDYQMALRHSLPMINILNPDGTLNEHGLHYEGLSVSDARQKILQDLEHELYLVSTEAHRHSVGHCYRSGEIIQPYLSTQWFVRMSSLAKEALQAFNDGRIVFYPQRWGKTYTHWLENIKDWCISRQLWWGHRIPAWYDEESTQIVFSRENPSLKKEYAGRRFRQETDVLDTWFSSWLWPFSTLGWPHQTADLLRFYPNTALVTAHDIIFFWVARMVMAGLEFIGEVPFRDIYITPLVRDKEGRKMSKSLGNGIDPLEIVSEYGADALKFTLSFLSAQGQDISLDKEMFQLGAKLANKLYHAARYLQGSGKITVMKMSSLKPQGPWERWLYMRAYRTQKDLETAMSLYRFNDAARLVYEFFWNDFCDWGLEWHKILLSWDTPKEAFERSLRLSAFFEQCLLLLHPFLPFLTEALWQTFSYASGLLMHQQLPSFAQEPSYLCEEKEVSLWQSFVVGVRTLRSEFSIAPKEGLAVYLVLDPELEHGDFFKGQKELAMKMIGASSLDFVDQLDPRLGIGFLGNGFEAQVLLKHLIDIPQERIRLERQLKRYQDLLHKTHQKLSNQEFVLRAPSTIVDSEKTKLVEFSTIVKKTQQYLENLGD